MQHLIANLEQHAALAVFLNAMITQLGLPLPVVPMLMAAAALGGQSTHQIGEVIVAGVCGAVLGDLVPYWCGRRYGRQVLGLACRVSLSPDFCVLRTENLFAKVGRWSLLFAKFIPGFSLISVVMAGVTRMSIAGFVLIDGIGTLLFVTVAVALGRIFQSAITDTLSTLRELGEFGGFALVVAVASYLAAKWLRRQLFIRQLRMDRITVAELRQLIDEGQNLVILDVRPREIRELTGIVPGAVGAHPADDHQALVDHSGEPEIVIYCDCPNEASAAIAAKHLKQSGFKKIRPLLGGVDAWVAAGHPVQPVPLTDEGNDTRSLDGDSLAA